MITRRRLLQLLGFGTAAAMLPAPAPAAEEAGPAEEEWEERRIRVRQSLTWETALAIGWVVCPPTPNRLAMIQLAAGGTYFIDEDEFGNFTPSEFDVGRPVYYDSDECTFTTNPGLGCFPRDRWFNRLRPHPNEASSDRPPASES